MDSKILTAEILQSVMADNLKNCQRYFQDSLTLLFLVEVNFEEIPVPILIRIELYYIIINIQRKAITIEEADKVLSIIKSVNEGSVYKFMRKRYDRLNPRAFRISFLYSQMFINFNKVLLCSGFNAFKVFYPVCVSNIFANMFYFQKTINFDGVLFHQNFENSAIDLESLQQFRFYQ